MALPEDDVEEIDPEPALARILDHEHDAIVIGPGLRPGLATAELVRLLLAAGDDDAAPVRARRRGPPLARDRWTTGGTAIAGRRVLTPHAGEFARLRAGSGHATRTPTATSSGDDAARAAAARDAAAAWRQVVVLQGRPDRHRGAGRAARRSPRSRTRRSRAAAPATSSPGRSASLLAQGLAPYDAARLGVYLHGLAGDSVRERLGDAGPPRLGPARADRDRPQAARRRRRAAREQRPPGLRPPRGRATCRRGGEPVDRPGCGSRRRPPGRSAGAPDLTRRRPSGDRGPPRGGRPRRRCRGRPGSRSTSTRVAANLAAIRGVAGGLPVMPVVKADAYGHGMVPVARALEAAGVDGLCVATLDEALALREAGIAAADPRPLPDPAGAWCEARAAAWRSPSRVGRRAGARWAPRGGAAAGVVAATSRSSSRSRPGSAAAACARRGRRRRRGRILDAPVRRSAASGRTSRRRRSSRDHDRAGPAASRPPLAALRAAGHRRSAPPRRRERRRSCSARRRATTASGPG